MADNIINKVNVGGTIYDIQDITSGYSQVEIPYRLNSGVPIGRIDINNTSYIIYAPNTSSSFGGLEADIGNGDTNLILNNINNN